MNSSRRIGFFTLAGVESAKLESGPSVQRMEHGVEVGRREGWYIAGRWKEALTEVAPSGAGVLASEFANWSNDAQSVLRFTKRFGPLMEKAQPGGAFRFPVFEWEGLQEYFRNQWESRIRRGGMEKGYVLDTNVRHRFVSTDGKLLRYETAQLWMLLELDLFTCPRERLRKCWHPDCAAPYFVAVHLGQRYCSDVCAKWAQKKWKLRWWKQERARRSAKKRAKAKTKKRKATK